MRIMSRAKECQSGSLAVRVPISDSSLLSEGPGTALSPTSTSAHNGIVVGDVTITQGCHVNRGSSMHARASPN